MEELNLDFPQATCNAHAYSKRQHSNPKWDAMQRQLIGVGISNGARISSIFNFFTTMKTGVTKATNFESVRQFADQHEYIFERLPVYSAIHGTGKTIPTSVYTAAFCVVITEPRFIDLISNSVRAIRIADDGIDYSLVRLRNIIVRCNMKPVDLFWMALEVFDCLINNRFFGYNFIRDYERRRLAKVYKLHYP